MSLKLKEHFTNIQHEDQLTRPDEFVKLQGDLELGLGVQIYKSGVRETKDTVELHYGKCRMHHCFVA